MLRTYRHPIDAYRRYLFGAGDYPAEISLKTPTGDICLLAYSHDDMLTVNEVFCREDYFAAGNEEVFVDFGSNIGISAAYFLTRSSRGFAYLYEPVPRNLERMRSNLAFLDGRFAVEGVAVGTATGIVGFGIEETGRYGSIGGQTGPRIEVQCLDSNDILQAIVARHGKIDVLKIDIEGLEGVVVSRILPVLRTKIGTIYAECRFAENPLTDTHAYRQYGSVAQFRRLLSL
jgi:FkbM family methyltransferase